MNCKPPQRFQGRNMWAGFWPAAWRLRIRGMVRHHHEMFDGSGYPDGLRGERIPLGTRIITVADCFDTMVSERAYKPGRTMERRLMSCTAAGERNSIPRWSRLSCTRWKFRETPAAVPPSMNK